LFFRNTVVLQLLNKEPLKTGTKPPVVPSYSSANGVDKANQNSEFLEKKNAHLHNIVKPDIPLDDVRNITEQDISNDNTFKMKLINKIENWSPLTAKYARLSIFGCKVSICNL